MSGVFWFPAEKQKDSRLIQRRKSSFHGSTLFKENHKDLPKLIIGTNIPQCCNGHTRWSLLVFDPVLRDAFHSCYVWDPSQPWGSFSVDIAWNYSSRQCNPIILLGIKYNCYYKAEMECCQHHNEKWRIAVTTIMPQSSLRFRGIIESERWYSFYKGSR